MTNAEKIEAIANKHRLIILNKTNSQDWAQSRYDNIKEVFRVAMLDKTPEAAASWLDEHYRKEMA